MGNDLDCPHPKREANYQTGDCAYRHGNEYYPEHQDCFSSVAVRQTPPEAFDLP
jgi:hypothetical protein